jgi:hypothetical protein
MQVHVFFLILLLPPTAFKFEAHIINCCYEFYWNILNVGNVAYTALLKVKFSGPSDAFL